MFKRTAFIGMSIMALCGLQVSPPPSSKAEYRVSIFRRHFGSAGVLNAYIGPLPLGKYVREAEESARMSGKKARIPKAALRLWFELDTGEEQPREIYSVVKLKDDDDRDSRYETRVLDALVEAGNLVLIYKDEGITFGLVVIDNQRVIPRQFEGTDRLTSDSDAIGDINAATISGSVSRGDLSVELVRGDGSRNEGFALTRVGDELQWERVR